MALVGVLNDVYICKTKTSVVWRDIKSVYDWSEYIWHNRSLYVCENFSAVYYLDAPVSKDDEVLSILTLVCMVISIIALVFVLVTYSLFTELRTPPGINLMNLSISILLAQLLWILGSGQTDTPIACTVIAVLLHYFFLVSFVWTSIIAFDTWRAFTGKGRRSLADSKRNRLVHCLRYMAVGWLSVMVYVAICIAIDQSEITLIGYGSRDACWIADNNAKLYFFAIPVGLIIVFNIVFYSMTVKAIRDTRSQTSLVNDQSDKKRDFDVYVRIGSLMGFTWIFGFAASFGWLFLSYVFVVLNSLHGVYIAVAFALNERAIKLYVDLVRGKPSSIKEKQQVDRGRTHGSAPVHTAVVSKLEETTTIIVNKSPITPRVACNIISLKDEIKKKAWY
ncbi:hypothetical protein QZH41_000949 [Actinostola sp. cb2023]|nr:hypothetical protein QZH41_000949 [Actinostola sp. cb2023]